METKTCTTCKFEPEWVEFGLKQGFGFHAEGGKCKFPAPPTMTPFVGRESSYLKYKDHDGKFFFDMTATGLCYAWEAKE